MAVKLVRMGAGAIKSPGVPVKPPDTPGATEPAALLLDNHRAAVITAELDCEEPALRDHGVIQ